MQFVEIELDPYETVIAEPGSFLMMDEDIEMKTIFGDGSGQEGEGVWGKVFSAGKRLLTGEKLFMTAFTHMGVGKQTVSFASPYPGKIIPLDLAEHDHKIICQKDASCVQPRVFQLVLSSPSVSVAVSLVAKVLSCRNSKVMVWPSCMVGELL